MKKSYLIGKHALALILSLLVTVGVVAQQKPRHYIGGWLFTGYSAMFHSIDNTSVIGGGGAGIGVGYQLRKGQFLFKTGLEFEFINSTTKVKEFSDGVPLFDVECFPNPDPNGEPIKDVIKNFNVQALKYQDQQFMGLVNLPVLLGMQFPAGQNVYYFLAGGKVGVPVWGMYNSSGKIKTTGEFERFIDIFENMPNHYFTDGHKFKSPGGKSDFKLINVMASLEFGMELNPYIFKVVKEIDEETGKAIKPKKDKNAKEEPRVRIALFADYGILNINNNAPTSANVLHLPKAGEESKWFGKDGLIKKDLPTTNLLATTGAYQPKTKSVNPFIVGVKGTILFDVTPPKKEKPIVVPPPPPPPPPPVFYITGKVVNVETGEVVTTSTVEMFTDKGKVFSAKPQYGIFNTKLDRKGTYKVNVTAPNFNSYSEMFSNVGDTMMIYIQPFKKNDIFIVRNIYFAHDKTTLVEASNKALDSLANFMMENPGVKFKIIGHTDGDGTHAYNDRLSNGRAQEVMKAIIARGIDEKRLTFEGRGKREPLCPANDTPECKAENRRVEFEITGVE